MSTSKIYVEVPIRCSRKDKDVPFRVPHDEVPALIEAVEKRVRNGAVLAEQLQGVPPNQLPHMVLVYKGQVVILPTVHESGDDAVKRALNAAVGADVFAVPPPKPRKKGEPESA